MKAEADFDLKILEVSGLEGLEEGEAAFLCVQVRDYKKFGESAVLNGSSLAITGLGYTQKQAVEDFVFNHQNSIDASVALSLSSVGEVSKPTKIYHH